MKKLIFTSTLLSCVCIMLQAQKIPVGSKSVQTTKQLQPMTQQPTNKTSQTRNTVPQQANRIKAFPLPDKLHFLTFRKSLLKTGMAPRTLMQNRAAYTNTSFNTKTIMNNNVAVTNGNSGTKNVMDNTIKKNNNSVATTRFNDKIQRIPLVYSVTKNYSDGHKATYILTDNTDTWSNDFSYTKNKKNSQVDNSNPLWNCVYTNESFNAQSTSFMNASVNQKGTSLIPGTIYSFDDYAKGNFREYVDGRNPVVVWTPTTVGKDSFNIQNPNGQTISQGVSNIVSQFSQTQGDAKAYEQVIYSSNLSDLNLLVTAGGSYSGYSGFAKVQQNQSQHHIYITYDAVKPLYTIIAQRPSNGYFADGKAPSTSSPLVVVQNVTYGTRLLANIDIQTSTFTNYDSLNLAYTDGVDNAALNFSMLANNKTLTFTGNLMVVGTGVNIPIVSLQNFQQQISDLFAQGNFRTASPIQYQLTDLDGNVLGVESMTDQFTETSCKPAQDIYTLKSVFFSLRSGADGKNDDSKFILTIGLDDGSGTPDYRIGNFTDEQTEYKSGSAVYSQPIIINKDANHPNGYTMDDFKNGGFVDFDLHCADKMFKSDDWDIASGQVTFNFVSQKGTPYPGSTSVDIPNFRLSSSTNGFTEGKQTIWFDGNFQRR